MKSRVFTGPSSAPKAQPWEHPTCERRPLRLSLLSCLPGVEQNGRVSSHPAYVQLKQDSKISSLICRWVRGMAHVSARFLTETAKASLIYSRDISSFFSLLCLKLMAHAGHIVAYALLASFVEVLILEVLASDSLVYIG